MLSCPREVLALIARNPAEMRALHATCRAIATRTRGTFCRMSSESGTTGTMWQTLQIHGMYTVHTIEFDPDGGTMWYAGRDFDGDVTPFKLMPYACIWDFGATVDNLIFGVVGASIMTALASDREAAEQFIGTYIDRLYAVIGFYNNFRGIDYAGASGPGKYIFAVQDGYEWTIRTTDVPLHLLRGTVLALELVRE